MQLDSKDAFQNKIKRKKIEKIHGNCVKSRSRTSGGYFQNPQIKFMSKRELNSGLDTFHDDGDYEMKKESVETKVNSSIAKIFKKNDFA